MTADREQTRRDDLGWIIRYGPKSPWTWTWSAETAEGAQTAGWEVVKIIDPAELEQAERRIEEVEFGARAERGMRAQAERERDEARERTRQADNLSADLLEEREALQARLAKVPALVEALQRLADVNTDDVIRDAAFHRRIARDALAAWEQE